MGEFQRTLGEAIDDTLKVCNDYRGTGLDGLRWTRTEVKHAIRSLYMDFVRTTASAKGSTTITLVEDQNVYDLPDDCLFPIRITSSFGTSAYIMTSGAVKDLDTVGYPINAGGTPYSHFRDTLRHNEIGVWPMPGLSMDGEEVDVVYVRAPSLWSDELDVPDAAFPEWLQKDVRFGAAAIILSEADSNQRKSKAKLLDEYWNHKVTVFKSLYSTTSVEEGMVPV